MDHGEGGSTRVAAGLINPITGKNFEPSWRIAEFYPQAIAFYRSLEQEFGETIWHPLPVLRLASSEKEWAKISTKLDLPEVRQWMGARQDTPAGFHGGVELVGGGWLDTRKFLQLNARNLLLGLRPIKGAGGQTGGGEKGGDHRGVVFATGSALISSKSGITSVLPAHNPEGRG